MRNLSFVITVFEDNDQIEEFGTEIKVSEDTDLEEIFSLISDHIDGYNQGE